MTPTYTSPSHESTSDTREEAEDKPLSLRFLKSLQSKKSKSDLAENLEVFKQVKVNIHLLDMINKCHHKQSFLKTYAQ